MKLRDQDFQAGDKVVIVYDTIPCVTIVKEINDYGAAIVVDQYNHTVQFSQKGCTYLGAKQELFHRNSITIDEHGRLVAIDYDYVKSRVSESKKPIIYKWRLELDAFDNYIEDTWEFDEEPTPEKLSKMLAEEHERYLGSTYWKIEND